MSSDCFAEHMIIVIDNTDAYISQMKQVIDSIRIVDITQLRINIMILSTSSESQLLLLVQQLFSDNVFFSQLGSCHLIHDPSSNIS
jgi:hypothetical protein